MTITIPSEFEPALQERARRAGQTPEQYILDILRPYLTQPPPKLSVEETEALLRSQAVDAGVSLTDEQLGRDTMYD